MGMNRNTPLTTVFSTGFQKRGGTVSLLETRAIPLNAQDLTELPRDIPVKINIR